MLKKKGSKEVQVNVSKNTSNESDPTSNNSKWSRAQLTLARQAARYANTFHGYEWDLPSVDQSDAHVFWFINQLR